jgi:hypothetical protein
MQFKIPKLVSTDKKDFIEFWARRYSYSMDGLYEENINQPLNENRVIELYRWKNGTDLSEKKSDLVKRVYIPELNHLPKIETVEQGKEYLLRLNRGQIWDFFWLHCLNPKLFPIFDQHTYRAMAEMDGLAVPEIPYSKAKKIDAYFSHYIPFISKIGGDMRRTDKALFAYGKELKTGLFST